MKLIDLLNSLVGWLALGLSIWIFYVQRKDQKPKLTVTLSYESRNPADRTRVDLRLDVINPTTRSIKIKGVYYLPTGKPDINITSYCPNLVVPPRDSLTILIPQEDLFYELKYQGAARFAVEDAIGNAFVSETFFISAAQSGWPQT